jgi:glycosyltransferase involved in cell wall biosynthesis
MIEDKCEINKKGPLVAILMCTYNGERFIEDQIRSIARQNYTNWYLIISDDGSTDHTLEIISELSAELPNKIQLRKGPRQGFAVNFLSLASDKSIKAEYFAFSDQDDVWLPEKIKNAVNIISANEVKNSAYLYCGRTIYTDEQLSPQAMSSVMGRTPSFANALVQSIAGGNTMIFNNEVKKLLENIGVVEIPSHDWWVYQIVTGSGGKVFYDTAAYVYYRQHESALIGGNTSLVSKIKRLRGLLDGHLREWSDKNIFALNKASQYLTDHSKSTLNCFSSLRESNALNRLLVALMSGIYRQNKIETLLLSICCLFKKL